MTVDDGAGIFATQTGEQRQQAAFLRGGAGVFCCAPVGGTAAYVANTYGVGIVSFGVCADFVFGSADDYRSVAIYHIVIAYASETAIAMPAVDVGNGEVAPFGCCGAMDDYLVDCSHNTVV